MTYFFETYGCQMNSAESSALTIAAKERGWLQAACAVEADLVLINTCSVRITAETRALGRIAHYVSIKKKSRNFTLVVAGCMAQRMGKELREKYPEVDYVIGTADRSLFPRILEEAEKQSALGEAAASGKDSPVTGALKSNWAEAADFPQAAAFSFSPSHLEEGRFRSFLPIMHGCDNFCSYCIVPYVRGREISRDPESIAREIELAGRRGVREITLLGQNVNSYNHKAADSSIDFPALLELAAAEAAKSGVERLRFLSANPRNFSPQTIRVMAGNKIFCRHLHLPVQHGSDKILAAMNRGYTAGSYLELVREIRAAMPGITLSTDILIGFPAETEEDLEQTLSLMEEIKFLYAYMYHFNPREGTAAWSLPGRIADDVKRTRLSRVIELQKKHTQELLKNRIGSRERVLVEGISRKNADELITRTEKDEMVVVPGPADMIGSFTEITLDSLRGNTFRAKEAIPCPGN